MSKNGKEVIELQCTKKFMSVIKEKDVIYRFYNLTARCNNVNNWSTSSGPLISLFLASFYYVLDNYNLLEDSDIGPLFHDQGEALLVRYFIKAYLSVMRERAFFEEASESWDSFLGSCLTKLRENSKSRITGEKAALLILNSDLTKILLVRGQSLAGTKYSIPKGSLEHGEDSTAAALREAYEETQLYLGPFLWDPYCYYHQDLKSILPMTAWRRMPIGPYDFLSGQVPLTKSEPVKLCFSGYELHFAPGVPSSLLAKAEALCSSEILGCELLPASSVCSKKWAQKNLPLRQASNIAEIQETIEKLKENNRKLPNLRQLDLVEPELSDWILISIFLTLCR